VAKSSLRLLAFGSWLSALACAETYELRLPDINLEAPDDLQQRLEAFRAGAERWHGDPKAVADTLLRTDPRMDVPWKAELYRPSQYQVLESPEWGTYVVRGYVYPSGHEMRYRVKIRPYKEIWYPVQISRYKIHELEDGHGHGHKH
jgi:hypothetical protein